VLPTLETKDDFNHNEYKMKILERFKNTYIEDKLLRIAMDGSLKIPIRILDTYNNNKGVTKYIQFIITSWLFFLFQIIEEDQNRLDDANKEYFYSVYKNNKDNFFEEIINNKNIFNLSVSKREEMLTAVKKNINLMKENPLKLLLKEIIS
jgi:fructuronate reductase